MPPWSCGFPAPQISKLESVVDCLVEVAASVLQFQKLVSSQLIFWPDFNRSDLFTDWLVHVDSPFLCSRFSRFLRIEKMLTTRTNKTAKTTVLKRHGIISAARFIAFLCFLIGACTFFSWV